MNKIVKYLFTIIALIIVQLSSVAQQFSVEVRIKNLPPNHVVFGSVSGDNFTPIDSFVISNPVSKIVFRFPANAHRGVYRIDFGKTIYARVMNEGPQQLDFIFDNESLIFETDFKSPVESLRIVQSKENSAWYTFLLKDREFKREIKLLQNQIDRYWQNSDTANVVKVANSYNQMQMDRDMFLMKTVQESKGLFVSQMIKNLREPILDGYLTPAERKKSFKKDFFKTLDFSNPDLINTSVYSDIIFNYLVSYNQPDFTKKQRETEYIKAVDVVMANVKTNESVRRFVLGYLVHGFKVLGMDNVINYITKKYNYTPR